MPTVLRFGGLRVAIYPNDHRPSHVHVIGRGCEAVYILKCAQGAVVLRENYGFARNDLASIQVELQRNLNALCGAWEKIHGNA
jgi:hypothetical protein